MIRLIIAIILLLLALLTIFGAPEFHVWMLAIVVAECCWAFALMALLVLVLGFSPVKFKLAANIISGIALLLFLSPIVKAYLVADGLEKSIVQTFPSGKESDRVPFSLLKLFASSPIVKSQEYTYAKYADTSVTMDFYPAKMIGPRPCVLVIHGGSWKGGDNKQIPELNSVLALKGYHVASLNYRMAPKWQSPAPVEDIANCIKYLHEHAQELHVDTSKIILLGRSAGAQIALLAAYTLHDKNIKGVVDYYGPADMVWGYSIPSNPLIMDSRKVMSDYIGGSYSQVPEKYKASSPVKFVSKDSPPTLIIHGGNDVLVAPEHSRRLNAKLQQNNIAHYWLKLPWATHGFDYIANGPGGQLSTFAVLQFLNSITK